MMNRPVFVIVIWDNFVLALFASMYIHPLVGTVIKLFYYCWRWVWLGGVLREMGPS